MTNSPVSIFVEDKYQNHLGFNDEIPTPKNFKYPNRCTIIWNVEHQKKEWRQYLGAGRTCVPEINEEN
tara:strand:+ start:1653 stop:1856 length:204 start_codon:yes stop_codon:yes gene_type:complete